MNASLQCKILTYSWVLYIEFCSILCYYISQRIKNALVTIVQQCSAVLSFLSASSIFCADCVFVDCGQVNIEEIL